MKIEAHNHYANLVERKKTFGLSRLPIAHPKLDTLTFGQFMKIYDSSVLSTDFTLVFYLLNERY